MGVFTHKINSGCYNCFLLVKKNEIWDASIEVRKKLDQVPTRLEIKIFY